MLMILLPVCALLLAQPAVDDPLRGVQLPAGDPIPDFRERPFVPPHPDPSIQNKRGSDFGPAIAFTVQLGANDFVRRGLTIRLPNQRGVCYDTDQLAFVASWQGGFLDISKTHFEDEKGNLPGRPGGPAQRWVWDHAGWADCKPEERQYRGHFLHGFRVVLASTVKGRNIWEMPGAEGDTITRTLYIEPGGQALSLVVAKDPKAKWTITADTVSNDGMPFAQLFGSKGVLWAVVGDELRVSILPRQGALSLKVALRVGAKLDAEPLVADLRNYVRGGDRRWGEPLHTVGTLGANDRPYTVDTLTLPEVNPWKSWLRPAAIDFFRDGRMAMSSMNGDLWIVSGIDSMLKELRWQRFATGLYEPLGLRIVDDQIYLLGRDRITRLHDLNRDGEADFYENFFSGGTTSPGYHAFSFDLQTDSKGNFYFVKSGRKADDGPDQNALIRVSPDGRSWQTVATGFRHPNGMGIGPDDRIVVSDNQGEFIPASKVSLVRQGGFYGYGTKVQPYDAPLFWLPMSEDNSSGGQLWAGPKWGPLANTMLHTSYGTCKLFSVHPQYTADGQIVQAAVIPLALKFPSGIMRGRVHPIDGQVYVSGLRGWGTTGKADGCINRVRYTGQVGLMIDDAQLTATGWKLHFTQPLAAVQPGDVKVEQWAYLYSEKYGSPELSLRKPNTPGHDPVDVKAVRLSEDGQTLLLELAELRPVDQMKLMVTARSRGGEMLQTNVFSTIHRVPKP